MSRPPSAPGFELVRLRASTSLRHVEFHPVLESTSTTARDLLSSLLENAPSLVLTLDQTAGRGRSGNNWWSSAGALTFSLVVDAAELPLARERRPLVSLAAGLAVRDALLPKVTGTDVVLKWPNDVFAGLQKVSGILVEQHALGDRSAVVIGIGVNVNNSLKSAPAEIAHRATSLFDLQGESFDLTDLLIDILNRLDARISQLSRQPRLAMSEVNRCHVLAGRTVTVSTGDIDTTGTCLGIDEDGQLVLQSPQGIHRCSSGIVRHW